MPSTNDPELRRAFLIDSLEGLAALCANQMRGGGPDVAKIGSLLRILSAETREVCFDERLMTHVVIRAND